MQTIKDGTTEFEVKDMRYKAIVDLIYPVGTVIAFAKDEKPPVLQYGEWKEVPAGKFLQSAFGEHKAGESVEAGLPNINGEIGPIHTSLKTASGAFSIGRVLISGADSGTGGNWREQALYAANFKASLSNAIYGSSDTVQPPAYIVHFYERVK